MAQTGRIFAINLLANSKPAERAFENVGKAAGRIPTPMAVAAASITAVFAAVVAVATRSFKALLDLGEEFNNVERIIRVGTGAVGADLAALQDSFRDVARSVPNSFADVASVIAELDTRTDLAGDGLELMAEQLLTLSRLMGSDAVATTRETTRLFNRFGLSAEEASDMLDLLFRASQASGAQVDQLAADVTKNAGALQAMGLGLEESVALIALFEREGVRTRTMVSALQTGFLKLTKDATVPLNVALAETFTELQTLDREAAVAKGLEIFGTSAMELVDAVRDGRLSVEEFTASLVEGDSSILAVAEETDGWRVELDKFKNFLKLEFEDEATAVFDAVTESVKLLIPAAENVKEAYEEEGLKGALGAVAEEWDRIYEAHLEPLWLTFLDFLQTTVKPLALDLGSDIGGAIVSGMANAVKEGVKNLFTLPDISPSALAAEFERLLRGLIPETNLPSMGGAPPDREIPTPQGTGRPTPPPRPSPSSSPSGSGASGMTGIPSAAGRTVEYAPGLFAAVPFADGGIVTGPTLGLVGEAGPEAIIPLDRAGGIGTTVVNVTVTSADPQAVVEAIRRYTRANGPLSQVVTV